MKFTKTLVLGVALSVLGAIGSEPSAVADDVHGLGIDYQKVPGIYVRLGLAPAGEVSYLSLDASTFLSEHTAVGDFDAVVAGAGFEQGEFAAGFHPFVGADVINVIRDDPSGTRYSDVYIIVDVTYSWWTGGITWLTLAAYLDDGTLGDAFLMMKTM
jgi:hypothetical protein